MRPIKSALAPAHYVIIGVALLALALLAPSKASAQCFDGSCAQPTNFNFRPRFQANFSFGAGVDLGGRFAGRQQGTYAGQFNGLPVFIGPTFYIRERIESSGYGSPFAGQSYAPPYGGAYSAPSYAPPYGGAFAAPSYAPPYGGAYSAPSYSAPPYMPGAYGSPYGAPSRCGPYGCR
jgi:hypothetical protein